LKPDASAVNRILNSEVKAAVNSGLSVLYCIGETSDEKEDWKQVLKDQIDIGLNGEDRRNCIIAYEPVWAIGTGVTASHAQAQEIHRFIRDLVAGRYGSQSAEDTTILYGGSCKASNAAELFANPDVDGGLIGGASLVSEEFCKIVKAL